MIKEDPRKFLGAIARSVLVILAGHFTVHAHPIDNLQPFFIAPRPVGGLIAPPVPETEYDRLVLRRRFVDGSEVPISGDDPRIPRVLPVTRASYPSAPPDDAPDNLLRLSVTGSTAVMGCSTLGLPARPVAGWTLDRHLDPSLGPCFSLRGHTQEQIRIELPRRRMTLDGYEYEAAAMRIRINDQPYTSYYFGYRMGLAAGESNWMTSAAAALPATWPLFPSSANNFELATLPPPFVEGEVVEYVNTKVAPGSRHGHYFYAVSEGDKALLDGNADWLRTGRTFKSGGYVPVCRFFYRPPAGGAPTHFFTADAGECERFKTQPGFTFEGTPFRASLPRRSGAGGTAPTDPAACPEKTVPLWRYFNQPEGGAYGAYAPNHRYLRNRVVGDEMTVPLRPGERPWAAEGIALCVPE